MFKFSNAFFKTWQVARIYYIFVADILWYQSTSFWRQENIVSVTYVTVFRFLAYNSLRILKSYGIISLTLKTSLSIAGGHVGIYKFQFAKLWTFL